MARHIHIYYGVGEESYSTGYDMAQVVPILTPGVAPKHADFVNMGLYDMALLLDKATVLIVKSSLPGEAHIVKLGQAIKVVLKDT